MIRSAIQTLLRGDSLSRDEAYHVMDEILSGEATESQISAFLVAMQMKGSTVDELAGSVDAYRKRIKPFSIGEANAIDISGTGGDDLGTFNISTAAAIVAAAAGAKVVKHGYHSVSSQCGSADVLIELGINTKLSSAEFYELFDETGLAFIFAPRYKPIPKNMAGIRRNIGARTLINILDPITKPALTRRQLIGVYERSLAKTVAAVLSEFGVFHGMVVCGDNGLDELNIAGTTTIVELSDRMVREYELEPESVGLKRSPISALRGGDRKRNSEIIRSLLSGEPGACLDVTLLNAGAALKIAGITPSIEEGVLRCREAVERGQAEAKLQEMIKKSGKFRK